MHEIVMMSNLGHKTFNNDIKDNDSIFTIKQYLPIYRCNLLCLPSQKYTENLVCIRQVCGYIGVRLMTKTHETPLRNVGTCSSLNQQQIQSAKARYIVTAAACLLACFASNGKWQRHLPLNSRSRKEDNICIIREKLLWL